MCCIPLKHHFALALYYVDGRAPADVWWRAAKLAGEKRPRGECEVDALLAMARALLAHQLDAPAVMRNDRHARLFARGWLEMFGTETEVFA